MTKRRDQRKAGFGKVDNEFWDLGYAKVLGVGPTAVYATICRKADRESQTWKGGIKGIMGELGISNRVAIKHVKALSDARIISVQKRKGKTDIYTITDISEWDWSDEKSLVGMTKSHPIQTLSTNSLYTYPADEEIAFFNSVVHLGERYNLERLIDTRGRIAEEWPQFFSPDGITAAVLFITQTGEEIPHTPGIQKRWNKELGAMVDQFTLSQIAALIPKAHEAMVANGTYSQDESNTPGKLTNTMDAMAAEGKKRAARQAELSQKVGEGLRNPVSRVEVMP